MTPTGASDTRGPHDYTIEVCAHLGCGAQLSRSGNGRCPLDRAHWSTGGMVVRAIARPDSEQDRFYRPGRVPAEAQDRSYTGLARV